MNRNTMKTLNALNENERAVMRAIVSNAEDGAGGDFASSDEIRVPGLTQKQIGGYLTALAQKKLIQLSECVTDAERFYQITDKESGGGFYDDWQSWVANADK